MEKLAIGYQMATKWTDPPIMLMSIIPYGRPAALPLPRPALTLLSLYSHPRRSRKHPARTFVLRELCAIVFACVCGV